MEIKGQKGRSMQPVEELEVVKAAEAKVQEALSLLQSLPAAGITFRNQGAARSHVSSSIQELKALQREAEEVWRELQTPKTELQKLKEMQDWRDGQQPGLSRFPV